jgi:UDP:flavonoid glycosyltransferase YjiC (YdhE family)
MAWMDHNAPAQFVDFPIPRWALGLACRAVRTVATEFLDARLTALAARLGVRVDDPSHTGADRHADLHLGLWSRHMRDRVPSDRPTYRVCGFTQAGNLGHPPELAPEVDEFLDAGSAPVVIGLGSIFSLTARAEIADAAAACADLGLRCLVIGHPSREWQPPKGALAVPYAPYNLVFDRAKAIVTHGGAGSTSEALRSGRPVIVAPFGYDQFAISWQVDRLGGGVRLAKRKRDRAAWRKAIEHVATDETIARRAVALGRAFRAERDGAGTAVEHIESLFAHDR